MKKILGLDLGTNSIGWAVINIDESNKPIQILGMGSRIIPLNSDDRDQFQKGQAISKNQDRTLKRTQRKGYDRTQLKKRNLKRLLIDLNLFPTPELMNLPSLALWELRNNAVDKDKNISSLELGRILYMLNQKRGYKSARGEDNQDKKDTDYVAAVKGRFAQLKESKQTIGQHFFNELKNANINNTYTRVKENVYPREAYIEEFDAIIEAQKIRFDFLTDDVVDKLRNEIIYFQRALKSQKGLVSVCEFESFETKYIDKISKIEKTIQAGPKVAPKSSPLFQLCKKWEVVNNLSFKVKNPEGSKYKWSDRFLSMEEMNQVVTYLTTNSILPYTELLKILKLKKEDVYANKQIVKGIQGDLTYSEINKILSKKDLLRFDTRTIPSKRMAMLIDKKTGEILEEIESSEIDAQIEREPLYQLWHTIYSIKDLNECKNALVKRFNIDEVEAEKLAKIDFNKQAFGNKSNKAMRKILPYLMLGYDYSQACSLAGYNHAKSLTKDEKDKQVVQDKLELLPKNSLRQPVVEKIINQMINVVNAIIDKYGKPDEIRVELARELKQSKDERESSDKYNRENENLNKEVVHRLTELGIPTTKRNIQKYKFIFPSRNVKIKDAQVVNRCIYCGESFNLSEALNGDNFDVDHIVPKSLLFDDSQTNKVLVHRSCNATKTNQTAYDYIAKKGEVALNEYILRVDDWFKQGIVSYSKMQRLKVSFEEYSERKKIKKETEADKRLWESFIDRQLRETQYIAKKSKEILEKICNNVTSTEGTVTAKLRELWGWDDVLMNLQLEKYKKVGQTVIKEWASEHGKRKHQKEEIANWSKRDDHRHHAVDALVIAFTQQGFIQRINTLNASDVKDEMNKKVKESEIVFNEKRTLLEQYLILQKPFSTIDVEHEADKILVSFKPGKKVATISRHKAEGKNKLTGVIVPRGALHEQFVYGKIRIEEKDKSLKYIFENPYKIVHKKVRLLIENRLEENENDSKKALESIKKNPIYIDEKKTVILEKATCFKEEYVIKYKIQDIKTKDVPYIVDERVKQLVKDRLDMHNGKEKEAFKDVLWFNESKQIPILTVRCFTGLSAVEAIKKDGKGMDIGFAKPGSNHHIAIYRDSNGKVIQHLCTFWHAVERRKYNVPYIIKDTQAIWNELIGRELPESFIEKLPTDNLELNFSMQQNEMFVLGLNKEEIEEAISKKNNTLLSKHLFLVWSLSDSDFWFRHHLETKNSELKTIKDAKDSYRYYRFKSIGALMQKNPIKIRINHIGEITKIGE